MNSGWFSGLSATLTCFFFVIATGMVCLIWRDRRRFDYWQEMGPRGRSDTVLHFSLMGYVAVSGYQRAIATFSSLTDFWPMSVIPTSAVYYLPLHVIFTVGILWWLCVELFGTRYGAWAWLAFVVCCSAAGITTFIMDED